MASRRRVRRGAIIALAAVAAVSSGVAVLSARRKPGAEPEPAPPVTAPPRRPAVPVTAAPQVRSGGAMPAAAPVRRNWAGLIAVPVVAIAVLAFVQVVTWPAPYHPTAVEGVRLGPGALESILGNSDERCSPPADQALPYPAPSSASLGDLARDGLSVPACETLALGTTATIGRYAGEVVEVTATLVVDPKAQQTALPLPDGRQRILFRIHTRNVGMVAVQTPFRFVWAAGQGSGWIPPAASSQGSVWVDPGWENDQFAAFDVSGDAQLSRLRLSLYPGSVEQTVDWVLG